MGFYKPIVKVLMENTYLLTYTTQAHVLLFKILVVVSYVMAIIKFHLGLSLLITLESGFFMIKKIIFAILFAVLSTLASAQSIPPQIQGQCINIQWVGTTLEASCQNYSWGWNSRVYQFSSLPDANYCIDFIQNINGFLICATPDQPPPPSIYIPPSLMSR